jgi:transposase
VNLGIFLTKFNNNDACLEHIKRVRFPQGIGCANCRTYTKFHKVKGRPVYECSCGWQISPLAGTIFEKSTTPLQLWFYTIFIMTATRSGISAKQLQRELGVTYKTAWRMMKQIRLLMADPNIKLYGEVEVDEAYFGGSDRNKKVELKGKAKAVVMGMVERNGKAYLKHIPNSHTYTLLGQVKKHVLPMSRVITDGHQAYNNLRDMNYIHSAINHMKQYVVADIHTETIDGMWGNIKRGIYGVYRHVSPDYLQSYLDEYGWRYNHRKTPQSMFYALLDEVAEVRVVK